jgi:hypothetical protein
MDMSRPDFSLYAQPGAGRLFSGQAPDKVHERLRQGGKDVLVSVNGDFWSGSPTGRMFKPIGLHVTDGILATTSTTRSTLIVDDAGKASIATVQLSMEARIGQETLPISDLNNTDTTCGLVIFTGPFNKPLEAMTTRPLAVVQLFEFGPRANSKVSGTVANVLTTGSATPTSRTILLAFNEDVMERFPKTAVEVSVESELTGHSGSVAQAVGGGPRIVHRGRPSAKADGIVEKVARSFVPARHPRSAVALSRDKKKMWWVVVDGRQPGYSVGINLTDLGRFLRKLGAWEAINLDGGGSSCLVVDGQVVNSPSDKGRTVRPVCNTLHLIRK